MNILGMEVLLRYKGSIPKRNISKTIRSIVFNFQAIAMSNISTLITNELRLETQGEYDLSGRAGSQSNSMTQSRYKDCFIISEDIV